MDKAELKDLVTRARGGCRESLNTLSEHFQDDLYRYLYRLTLNQSLAEDIRQETLLQMCKSIGDVRKTGNFKAWLFKIAWNNTASHFRSAKKHSSMSIHENNLIDAIENERFEGLKALVSKEIADTLIQSISQLDPKQRSILVLRCYEELSYSEIAAIMNCTNTTARVLFYRAKTCLKQQLSRKGVTFPMFLGLLGLFGQVTSPAEAAVTVSASTLKVGTGGAIIGWLIGRMGLTLLTFLAGLAVVAGVVSLKADPANIFSGNSDTQVKSFHFTKHAWKDAYIPTANLRMGRSLSKGAYEQWFFFPEGLDGPLFKMTQRWDPEVENKLCSWLLNENGQHYYHSEQKTIYLLNDPLPRRRTARFPSDDKGYCDFLDSVEGIEEGLEYTRDPNTGYLVEMIDRRFANAKDFVSGVEQNSFDETEFGNFRYRWPEDAAFVDERDPIHQQGWTRFEISGQLNGRNVYGQCRIPFVYGKRQEFPPLLMMHIGDQRSIVDSPEGAFVLDEHNRVLAAYPSGSFFKGLLRPWFGLHTIDSVRRDAARQRIPFTVENLDYGQYQYQRRIVTLQNATGYKGLNISIDVDINQNQIQKIEFISDEAAAPQTLVFSYPQTPADIAEPIEIPNINKRWFTDAEPIGILWLFELAQGTLGQRE
ncbi:MAG: RNA polymerase sigma factor [Planctomycetota bacterium]|jgi:RNA polymerase sigma-70 factor (ECF subfamily)